MAGIITRIFGGSERSKKVDTNTLKSLLGMMEDQVFNKEMLDTHAPHDNGDIDAHSLFVLVENTLKGTTRIVDCVVSSKGSSSENQVEYKPAKDGFAPPLEAIAEVTCQLICKALDTKNVRETLVSLFHELSGYSWVAKAVLTFSSFSIYYADFWRLAQVEPSDKFGESVAILKGLPAITKPVDATKVFGVLNEMIKTILEMTGCIVEFEQESKDVPELSTAIDISTSVTQIIISILACSIQFTTLISMVDECVDQSSESFFLAYSIILLRGLIMDFFRSKGKDLPAFARKVNMIDHTIRRQFEDFMQKKEEIREHQRLQRLFNAPTDNVELIKALIHTKDEPQPLYLGSKKTTDKIDSLRRKNVLLLVSDLKLTTYDISIIMGVYKERKFQEGGRYEILWIPIVEQESEDLPSQFKSLQSQMPWYTVHRPSLINKVATKVIKEKWHFRQETILVVLGPQGVPLLRLCGLDHLEATGHQLVRDAGERLGDPEDTGNNQIGEADIPVSKRGQQTCARAGGAPEEGEGRLRRCGSRLQRDEDLAVLDEAGELHVLDGAGADRRARLVDAGCPQALHQLQEGGRVRARNKRVKGCDQQPDDLRLQGHIPVRRMEEAGGCCRRKDAGDGAQGAPRQGGRPGGLLPLLRTQHGRVHAGERQVSGLPTHHEERGQVRVLPWSPLRIGCDVTTNVLSLTCTLSTFPS
ncbi:hypothetical protein SAY87_007175 [Trapa incisa]|uniref:Sieve element occlusion N-terminal domain-containing protein n=1 Tax=Trapa incisa TaxID=236973 RepID=A0AAN7JXI0_9MYRT|nr:hypothetical protein SAY87_007175 [Trapa incisa]